MASSRGKSKPLGDVIHAENAEDTQRRARVGIEAFSQLPDDAVIYVWRRDNETKEFASTGVTFAPDEFSVDAVGEKLGGGTFQARVMVIDDTGRKVPGGQRQFKIEGPAKTAPESRGSGVAGQATVTGEVKAGPVPGSARESIIDMGIMAMFKQMQDNSQMQMMMMKEMVESRKSGPDFVALLAAAAPLVASLISTMGNRKDPNEIAADLLERFKPNGGGLGEVLSTMRALVELRELVPGSSSSGSDDDPATIALKTFGPVVAEMLTAKKQENVGSRVARTAIGTGAGSAATAATLPAKTDTDTGTGGSVVIEPQWATALRPHMGQLVRIAASGKDPVDFAHTIVAYFMPEAHKGTVRELVLPGADEAAAKIIEAFPTSGIGQYPHWLVEFVDGIRQELVPEEYEDEDENIEAAGQQPSGE